MDTDNTGKLKSPAFICVYRFLSVAISLPIPGKRRGAPQVD
jgi:hypothetical protein